MGNADGVGGTGRRRRLRTVSGVHISYVLRLRPNYLKAGHFTGEVESVATGHSFPVAGLEQLIAYVLETADEDASVVRGNGVQLAVEP